MLQKMGWKSKSINIGEISENRTVTITFVYNGILNISKLKASCGCSKPRQVGNTIVVKYDTGSVPVHLRDIGQMNTKKYITVEHQSGKIDTLDFYGIIFKE